MLIDSIMENYLAKYLASKGHFDVQLTKLIGRIINISLWVVGVSLILKVFNYDITAIITGLGIGGLAIALAAQDTLGNFFSSVSIIADKPFKIGDIIKFGVYEGTITDIGMRTTRIETYFGTQIAVPNSELAKSVVENLSKRKSIKSNRALTNIIRQFSNRRKCCKNIGKGRRYVCRTSACV